MFWNLLFSILIDFVLTTFMELSVVGFDYFLLYKKYIHFWRN